MRSRVEEPGVFSHATSLDDVMMRNLIESIKAMYTVYKQTCSDICRNIVADFKLPDFLGFDQSEVSSTVALVWAELLV